MPNALDKVLNRLVADERTKKAAAMIEAARFRAVLDMNIARAFWTDMALSLTPVPVPGIPTMCTDGKRLMFDPEFTVGLTPDEVHGLAVGHETIHCAQQHFGRIEPWMDPSIAQIAADCEDNELCIEAKFVLPKTAVIPGRGDYDYLPTGKSLEEYYRLIWEHEKQKPPSSQSVRESQCPSGGGSGPGSPGSPSPGPRAAADPPGGTGLSQPPDPGGCGSFIPAPDPATAAQLAATWQGLVAAAAQAARGRGDLPAGLKRFIDRVLKPTVSGREILRDYLMRAATSDRSWSRPNRRYLHRGLYLPGRSGEVLGEVVFSVDTSGSMGEEQLAVCAGVLEEVLQLFPAKLYVMYSDAAVHRVDEWTPDDGPLGIKFDPVGGGGTSHRCVWDEIENRGIDPSVVLCASDLDTEWGERPPYDVVWLATENTSREPPWGIKVVIA